MNFSRHQVERDMMHQKKDETGHICLHLPIGLPPARQIVDLGYFDPAQRLQICLSRCLPMDHELLPFVIGSIWVLNLVEGR